MTSEIQDGIGCLVESNCKCDATGKEFFHFLMSQRPNSHNLPIAFVAAYQQCLHSDCPSGDFIWVCPPDEFISHVSDLVCFALKDHPDNGFFDKAFPFLPADVHGAFQLYKQSGFVEKCRFSITLCQGMDDKWCSSIAISLSNDHTNLVTVQDSGSHDPLDASQVPNSVSMDSNQGAKDSSQSCVAVVSNG